MRAACLIVIAAAACGKQGGMYLQIAAPAGAKSVELFFGHDPASSNSISPLTSDTKFPNGRYFSGEGWTSVETLAAFGTLSGSRLTYRVEGGGSMLPRLLIIAYDDQDQPVGVKILDDVPIGGHAAMLPVTLDPAVPIQTLTNASSPTDRVQVWRRPDDESIHQRSACALVWHAGDTTGSATEFFVPADDTDCDGALPRDSSHTECNSASEWNYCEVDDTKLGISEASCMLTTRDNGACRVGAPPMCVDGGDNCTGPACTPSPVIGCLPEDVCAAAQAHNCSTLDPACLGVALNLAATIPRFGCPLQSDAAGTYCGLIFDANNFGAFPGRTCNKVNLATFAPAPKFGASVTADGLTYTLGTGSGTGCAPTLTITGMLQPPMVRTPVFVVIDTLPSPDESFYVPLEVEGVPQGTCPMNRTPCVVQLAGAIACP